MNVEPRRGQNEAGLETEHRGAAALRESSSAAPTGFARKHRSRCEWRLSRHWTNPAAYTHVASPHASAGARGRRFAEQLGRRTEDAVAQPMQ